VSIKLKGPNSLFFIFLFATTRTDTKLAIKIKKTVKI
jgi:hypothetical protein